MIELVELTKTYKTKKSKCEALKGINLKFGNKGLIFIVGKSGSGKSTLMNLLGGIDTPTSGKIIYNNSPIDKSKTDLELYRSNCIGFIFQDYCLIETMSVYDNIEIGLSVNGLENHELILEIIEKLELTEKINTPVNLLSGGQKQRVAIARALVKNPNILLADEPTGNLDSKTGTQTFEILKKLSNDKLVIVISHNLTEAYKYADRIIELSDGNVINDLDRINSADENKNIALLSADSNITNEEVEIINDKIHEHNVVISKNEMMFEKHQDTNYSDNEVYPKTKSKLKRKWKLYSYFIKKKIFGILIHSLMISTLIILMGLCQSYNNVDEIKLISDAIAVDDSPMILRKGYYDEITERLESKYLGRVTDEDIEKFKQTGYDGNIYKLYRFPIPLVGNYDSVSNGIEDSGINFSNGIFLSNNGYGVLQCDLDYLVSIYGKDGKLEVLAGDLNSTPYGITITDYFADCILSKNPSLVSILGNKYEKIVNASSPIARRYKVNAVIETNYEERYSYIIEKLEEISKFPNRSQIIMEELKKSPIMLEFLQENRNYLATGYSFNENFIEDSIENFSETCFITYFENAVISDENNQRELYYNKPLDVVVSDNDFAPVDHVNDGEVYISADHYNLLFNTNISYDNQDGFVERDIYLNLYSSYRRFDDEAKYSKKLRIVGLINYKVPDTLVVSDNDYKDFRRAEMSAYALYFSDGNNEEYVYNVAEELLYKNSSIYITTVQEIAEFTIIFKSIFVTLIIGLILTTIVLLSNYSVRLVNSFKRELGIIKAMGGKNSDFQVPFIIIVLIIGVIAAILCSLGIVNICEYINGLVIERLAEVKELPQLLNLKLLQLSPNIIIYDLIILFGLTLVSVLFPISALRKIKLVDILRRE